MPVRPAHVMFALPLALLFGVSGSAASAPAQTSAPRSSEVEALEAASPPPQQAAPSQLCRPTTTAEIAALFDRWNRALSAGDIDGVLDTYADSSVLLPTLSGSPRLLREDKKDYFEDFLAKEPTGTIDGRVIQIGCNTAVDVGHYTFRYATDGSQSKARYTYTYVWDGTQWLITSHHSSVVPDQP